MKSLFSSLLKFSKKNTFFVFLLLSFPISFILLFRNTKKSKNDLPTSYAGSSHLTLPELKEHTKLYNSKIEAYRKSKRKKDLEEKLSKPHLEFPSSFEEPIKEPTERFAVSLPTYPSEPFKETQKPLEKKTAKIKKKLPSKEDLARQTKLKKRKELEEQMKKQTYTTYEKDILLAEINHNQIITNGKEIRFHLLEDTILEGVTIPAYTPFYGKASFNTHRIEVVFSSIVYQNRLFPFKRILYDFDGFIGIAIDAKEELQERDQHVQDEAMDLDQNLEAIKGGKYIAQGVHTLKKVFTKKEKNTTVELISGHRILLKKPN